MIEVLIVGGIAAGAAVLLMNIAPRAGVGIVFARRVIIGIFALIGSIILISTNQTGAMVVGALVLFMLTLAFLVDKENEAVW